MTTNPETVAPQQLTNTPPARLAEIVQLQQEYFASHATRPVEFRIRMLKKLRQVIKQNEPAILEALHRDFGKPKFEAYATEIGFVYEEIRVVLKNLREWAAPQRVSSPRSAWPSKSYILHEPKGVTLIIGPWNYPFQLLLAPMIASISAGNTCIAKAPEQTYHTSLLVEKILSENFESRYLAVLQGEGEVVVTELMQKHRFDHVLFTGSTAVGRKVAEMAAQKLVPTTLELGGKSPAVVDSSADLKTAAKRIAFGKWLNAGQTCVAPDYVLVERSCEADFLQALEETLQSFYPHGALESEDYTCMIHREHYEKVAAYLKEGKIAIGGQLDEKRLRIAPTVLTQISLENPVMQEEIFGPVLPVLSYKEPAEAIDMINRNPRPLALYLFAEDKNVERVFLNRVQFGGGAVNNTLVHLSNPKLPFGGIGDSGYGNYHGIYGFRTFSHQKSIMKTATWFDLKLKYPPYSTWAYKLIKKLMK